MSIDSYVPTSPDGLAMHKLRRMVALSDRLRTRCGLGYQDLWERCFYRDCASNETVPFYLIDLNTGDDTLLATGAMNYLIPKGNLVLLVEVGPKPGLGGDNNRRLEVVDLFSDLRRDISELSAADDTGSEDGTSHLDIHTCTLQGIEETPKEIVDSTGAPRYLGIYTIAWGPEGNG